MCRANRTCKTQSCVVKSGGTNIDVNIIIPNCHTANARTLPKLPLPITLSMVKSSTLAYNRTEKSGKERNELWGAGGSERFRCGRPLTDSPYLLVLRGPEIKGVLVDNAVVARLCLHVGLVVKVLRPAALRQGGSSQKMTRGSLGSDKLFTVSRPHQLVVLVSTPPLAPPTYVARRAGQKIVHMWVLCDGGVAEGLLDEFVETLLSRLWRESEGGSDGLAMDKGYDRAKPRGFTYARAPYPY